MTNKDSIEKKANKIWIVSFIITGLCILYVMLFRNIDYSGAMIAEFVYLFTGIFGSAVFVQTKKPMAAKIIVIIVLTLFFSIEGATASEGQAFLLFVIVPIPFSILLGTANMKVSKEKTNMTIALVSVLIIAILISVWVGIQNRPTGVLYIDDTTPREYNAYFVHYEGQTNVKGANIKALCRDVMTHNRDNSDDNTLWIDVIFGDTASNNHPDYNSVEELNDSILEVLNGILNGGTYAVKCGYDKSTGYVVSIAVKKTN